MKIKSPLAFHFSAIAIGTAVAVALHVTKTPETTLFLRGMGTVCLADNNLIAFGVSQKLVVQSHDGVPADEIEKIKAVNKDHMREVGGELRKHLDDITLQEYPGTTLRLDLGSITQKYRLKYQEALGAERIITAGDLEIDPLQGSEPCPGQEPAEPAPRTIL